MAVQPMKAIGTVAISGLELAAGAVGAFPVSTRERYVLATTAGGALWNRGVAYAVGLALARVSANGWLGIGGHTMRALSS
jgi:hypothetical protein